ncbi:MAG: PAS domain S-box protein, partial [Sphingobacteriales bacterium]
ELIRAEERLGGSASWLWNLHTGERSFSDQYYRLLGLQPRSVEPSAALLLYYVHPEDRERMAEAFRQLETEHQAPELEYRVLRQDGQTRCFQLRVRTLVVPSGSLLLAGTIKDITMLRALERREARTQVVARFREELQRVAETAAGICTWVWDLEHNRMEWSDGFYSLLGYKRNFLEFSQKLLTGFLHTDDRKAFNDAVEAVLQTRADAEVQVRILVKEETKQLRVRMQVLSIEGSHHFVAVFRDETELHRQQRAAVHSSQLFNVACDQVPHKIFITDRENVLIHSNDAARKWLQGHGLAPAGLNLLNAFPRLRDVSFLAQLNAAFKGEASELPSPQATEGSGRHQLFPVRDEAGTVFAVLHLVKEPARGSGDGPLAETIADVVDERIIVLDRRMNYVIWNRTCEEQLGIPREEILGHNVLEHTPDFLEHLGYQDFRRALQGETVNLTKEMEPEQPSRASLVPVLDEAGSVASILWVARTKKDLQGAAKNGGGANK